MSGGSDGWEDALSRWAHARSDIHALVQIGSRVQASSKVDRWSDFDYQLITSRPECYRDGSFAKDLGACWAYGAHVAFGRSVKVTAVYEGALEADFVILSRTDLAIACLAMRFPGTQALWPRPLRIGVADLRIVVGPGWKMIKGGAVWEKRYSRIAPYRAPLTQEEFQQLCGTFWTQLVWAVKKMERGEFRASLRALHEHLLENSYRMFQEEAFLNGRRSSFLARRAEEWVAPEQLAATSAGAGPDREGLKSAFPRIADAFQASSAAVAAKSGWTAADYSAIRGWLAASDRAVPAP